MKRYRLVLSILVVAAAVAFVVFVPLPHEVKSVFTIKPRGAKPVYPRVAGQLVEILVQPGDVVHEGQLLARIENLDLKMQLTQLEGDKQRYEAQLDNLRRLQVHSPGSDDSLISGQILQIEEVLLSTEKELVEVREQLAQLDVLAPVAGTVLPPEPREAPPPSEGRLPSWTGSPLEAQNLGATLAESDLLCRIGDPRQLEAELILDQAVVDFVHSGQRVRMKLASLPHEVIEGKVGEIGLDKLEVVPPSLTAKGGGGLEVQADPSGSGVARPLNPSYPARVVLPDNEQLQIGLKGNAKVAADWQPLGARFYRYVARTFHFDW